MPNPSINEVNRQFCVDVAAFCTKHDLGPRKLALVCEGHKHNFQKSQASRFLNLQCGDDAVEAIRPVLAASLRRFLEEKNLHCSEIEAELLPIFEEKEFTKMIGNRTVLTSEACEYFGFRDDPFDIDRLPRLPELFHSPELDSVARRVRDRIARNGFMAVLGPVGAGKTEMKRRIRRELMELDENVLIIEPQFFNMNEINPGSIAEKILFELGQERIPRSKEARMGLIQRQLKIVRRRGSHAVLILDECHRLSADTITSLKNVWEMYDADGDRLLAVMLLGQPAFENILQGKPISEDDHRRKLSRFDEIRQRVDIIPMPRLIESARDYLAHRITLVGGSLQDRFEPGAIERICLNAATPLALGNLANEALKEAFENDEQKVLISFDFFTRLARTSGVRDIRPRAA
jgi:type II secretory pathway predicted ATPase ExeA